MAYFSFEEDFLRGEEGSFCAGKGDFGVEIAVFE